MTKITRRNLFKLMAGAAIMPYTALTSSAKVIAEADFGFTWGKITVNPEYKNLSDIITSSLRANSKILSDNVAKNNAVLLKLKENNYIKVNLIDPEVQKNRIVDKLTAKKVDLINPNSLISKPCKTFGKNADFSYYDGYENIGSKIWSETNGKISQTS